jgi:4-diphosphocytidyl-2-C-methyl-D-erythritol kinase
MSECLILPQRKIIYFWYPTDVHKYMPLLIFYMINFPNAKINIGLNITERRPDGYHNLETVFYPVKINDVLEVIEAPKLSFESSGLDIPGRLEDNLCIKGYHLLKKDFDLPPVKIHLHKNIPIGAGLGGGSADAAFFIKLMNDKFGLGSHH